MTVDDLIGKKIQGYEIQDRIGQGGMATVYRALQTSMNRTVAIKILPKHLMRDDSYLMRFQREADIISRLEHRNIIPVYDYGNDDGLLYLVMRYMPAGSIDDRIRLGALSYAEIQNIIQQIAPALDYAHARGVLHRDLKPSNILLDDDGGAYLTDFGIARIFDGQKEDTITTQGIVGTPSYMSPEQAQGHTLDGRSDIYSLGISLFEMATGRRPFENDTPYSIAVMQVTAQPPNPRHINPDISPALEEVILKAIKKKPKNRFSTALELSQALDEAIQNPNKHLEVVEPINVSLDVTQPSGILSESDFTVPHPVTPTPIPAHHTPTPQPKPLSYPSHPSRPRPASASQGRVLRKKKGFNGSFWASVVIGGLIGCALLTMIVVALGMMANDFLRRDRTQTTIHTPIPSLDPTAESALATMAGNAAWLGLDSETPIFPNVTPIPTREATSPSVTLTLQQPIALPSDFDPNISQMIYFASSENGLFDLFLMNLRTGEQIRLTQNQGDNLYPMLSPDGKRIAFQSNRDGQYDIFVMDLASRESVKLIALDGDQLMPAWSPDGRYIVFASDTRGDGTYDLARVESDGTSKAEVVYSDGLRNNHPRYSPDGRYLTFMNGSANDARDWRVLVFDWRDGSVRTVSGDTTHNAYPMFAPDGAILYVADGDDGQRNIIRTTGTLFNQRRILYSSAGLVWGMHYSPDGEFIVFHQDEKNKVEMLLMRDDGTDVTYLDGLKGYYPIWIP
jgi:serine/threonine protein kinase